MNNIGDSRDSPVPLLRRVGVMGIAPVTELLQEGLGLKFPFGRTRGRGGIS